MAQQRVIISGATSGLGAACARRLVDDGAAVWVLGRREEAVARALETLQGASGGSVCDIADPAAVDGAVSEAARRMGGLDGAFVNAGIDGEGVSVLDIDAEHFLHVLNVNVVGTFSVARAAARAMTDGGAIVLNASVNALRAERLFADYNASKGAVVSLAQTMAVELAAQGITVSSICPGYFPTAMTKQYLEDPKTAEHLLADVPAGRFGHPEEVASLVAFLLSTEARYMSGAVVSIDGGRSV